MLLLKINKTVIVWNKLINIQKYYKDNNDLYVDADQLLYKIYEKDLIFPEDVEREFNKFCDSWNIDPNDPAWSTSQ